MNQTYSDALINVFSQIIPRWNGFSPSSVTAETTEEFRALLNLVKTQPKDFFHKIQNLALPVVKISN